jgi:hypothetical protein
MFEDFKEPRLRSSNIGAASDREILAAIWTRKEIGDLTAAHLWGELYRRYPQEPRFLLLTLFESLSEPPVPGTSPSAHFLTQSERIASAAPELHPLVADLLVVGEPLLKHDMGPSEIRALAELRRRVVPKGHSKSGASGRIENLAQQVMAEYHDKSAGGPPILPTVATAPSPALGPEKDYSPTQTFAVGDRVRHSKFGVGVVSAVLDGKVEIRFPQGTKLLACAPPQS